MQSLVKHWHEGRHITYTHQIRSYLGKHSLLILIFMHSIHPTFLRQSSKSAQTAHAAHSAIVPSKQLVLGRPIDDATEPLYPLGGGGGGGGGGE